MPDVLNRLGLSKTNEEAIDKYTRLAEWAARERPPEVKTAPGPSPSETQAASSEGDIPSNAPADNLSHEA